MDTLDTDLKAKWESTLKDMTDNEGEFEMYQSLCLEFWKINEIMRNLIIFCLSNKLFSSWLSTLPFMLNSLKDCLPKPLALWLCYVALFGDLLASILVG